MNRHAFTLVELAVVVMIIGILAALALPKLLGATSKAKLSEFKPVLKSIYTLQETHFTEAGSYSTDKTVIGYSDPGGKANFSYILTHSLTGILGTAATNSKTSIKISDGNSITASSLTACVDSLGLQYAHSGISGTSAMQVAKDAGLLDSTGKTMVKACN